MRKISVLVRGCHDSYAFPASVKAADLRPAADKLQAKLQDFIGTAETFIQRDQAVLFLFQDLSDFPVKGKRFLFGQRLVDIAQYRLLCIWKKHVQNFILQRVVVLGFVNNYMADQLVVSAAVDLNIQIKHGNRVVKTNLA